MRWRDKVQGAKRIVKFFAFLPVFAEDDYDENRWLEVVTVKQEYVWPSLARNGYWKNIKFIDKEK